MQKWQIWDKDHGKILLLTKRKRVEGLILRTEAHAEMIDLRQKYKDIVLQLNMPYLTLYIQHQQTPQDI